jgi:hypothetical protein
MMRVYRVAHKRIDPVRNKRLALRGLNYGREVEPKVSMPPPQNHQGHAEKNRTSDSKERRQIVVREVEQCGKEIDEGENDYTQEN